MKNLITSDLRRQGRALAALALAMAALVWLLGMWGGLPAAEARGPAAANTGGADLFWSTSDVITIFLPLVFKAPPYVFFDDFSSTSSGWPHKKSWENCYFEYYGGRYRVKVSANGQECIIPNFKIPNQINGTFSVKVRRTSSEDRHMFYGIFFGAGPDATEDRWAVQVYPNKDPDCSNKPFYWLYALVDGDVDYFKYRCTDTIDKDEDDWNELKIVRNGKNIKVYINGQPRPESGYNDADYLRDKGYSLLYVASLSNQDIYVEFDDFKIESSTAAP